MPLWLWLVDSLALIVALTVLLLAWFVARRRILASSGSFDLSTNRHADPGPGWVLGFAVYGDTELRWYRTFSLTLRPAMRFTRGSVLIEGRRAPQGGEMHALHAGHVVVETDNDCGVRQFAMNPTALTGLLSWLESSPPGQRVNNVL